MVGKLGNGNGKKQDLFLMYLDAMSVTKPGGAQQRNLVADPKDDGLQCGQQHGMPFTGKDLEFVTKFTEEFDGDQLRCDHQSGRRTGQPNRFKLKL